MNDDWLEVETPDDWLSTEPTSALPAVIEEPGLTARPVLPESAATKLLKMRECVARLSSKQQYYIETLRNCRWNERAAIKALSNTPFAITRTAVWRWREKEDYAYVYNILKADAAGNVLDTDKLLLRQEDIIEQLMTPQPILHQGAATGYFENRAPAASKANEVLMKAAGLLKNDEQTTRHVVRFVNLAGPEVQTAIEVATEIT